MGEVGSRLIVAVDGGNSKTDVVVLAPDGTVLARVRGGGYSPHVLGTTGAVAAIEDLVHEALRSIDRELGPTDVEHVAAFLAGVDLVRERSDMVAAIVARNWSRTVTVDNDTFALLRLASLAGTGVAVVCGAGINCVAVDDGRTIRFPSLGPISGDWGGGLQLGVSAMTAAARDADGRGPRTALTQVVLDHFHQSDVLALIERLHFGEIPRERLAELSPQVFAAAAAGDQVADELVSRLAGEIASFAIAALRRLGLTSAAVPIVLGGSILAARLPALEDQVRRRILEVAPNAELLFPADPPILGAALLALDAVRADPAATDRLRSGFAAPVLASGAVR